MSWGSPRSRSRRRSRAGSSRWQVITKVQLPLSRKTVALAANQGLIYVLSVVTLGGLVGAGALGYLTIAGFAQSDLWGKGFVAGVAIVVLGILLDRVTQAAARRPVERRTRHHLSERPGRASPGRRIRLCPDSRAARV